MIAVLLFIIFIILLYFLTVKPYSYWSRRNVPTGKVMPIFGDYLPMILGEESFPDMMVRVYNKFEDARYIGGYQFVSPFFLVKSPELIKRVCIKDFDCFANHIPFFPEDLNSLLGNSLVTLKDQKWKDARSTFSSLLTSSKIRSIFGMICHNAKSFVEHYLDKKQPILEVEFNDACTRYASDIIADTIFGLNINSLKDKNNDFYNKAKDSSNFSNLRKKLVIFFYQLSPLISKLLRIQFIAEKEQSFFINLVKDTIKMREKKNIERPDILGFLMQTRESNNGLKDESKQTELGKSQCVQQNFTEIASKLYSFYLAGFEPLASELCFLAYELALNPDVQKKLTEEVDRNKMENEEPTYETILNMPYMDMVVSELLRKWPTTVVTDRTVTKPYTIEPELPDEKPIHLDIGCNIIVPILPIHRDPKYYENPEKFDPERFSPENRKKINSYTYMPFGVGPRNCIGSRFVFLVMKVVLFYILSHFEIVTVENTQIPLKIKKSSISLTVENNLLLGLKKRE